MNGINILLTQADFTVSDKGYLTVKGRKLLNCVEIDNRFFRTYRQNIMYFNEEGFWEQLSKDDFIDEIQNLIIQKAQASEDESFFFASTIMQGIIKNLRAKLDKFPTFNDIENINANNTYKVITKSKIYLIHTKSANLKIVNNIGQFYNFVAISDFTPADEANENNLLSAKLKSFFNLIACGDKEIIRYLQELMGHTLVHGFLSQPYIYMLYGGGKNGKSVFLDLLSRLVSQHKSALNFCDISMKTAGTLEKNLINLPSELDGNKPINESMLKGITSGDAIEIDEKYLMPRTIKPIAKQIGAANTLPPNMDSSDGLWRRIIIIPFFAKILEAQKETPEYFYELFTKEITSLRQWAFLGLLRMIKNKGVHSKCLAVENAVNKYKLEENSALQFMNIVHEFVANNNKKELNYYYLEFSKSNQDDDIHIATKKNIYNGYKSWVLDEGIKQLSSQQFHDKLKKEALPWLKNVKQNGSNAYAINILSLRQKMQDRIKRPTNITVEVHPF